MRDSNLESSSFLTSIEMITKRFLRSIDSRSSAPINPKYVEDPRFENCYEIFTWNKDDLVLLGILSWFVDPTVGTLIRLDIQEKIQNNSDLFMVNFFIHSKEEMYLFLLESQYYHTRDFFGNLLTENRLSKVIRRLRPCMKTRKRPKRVQRHRGYRDKGTLKPNHENHSFVSFTKEQREKEELDQARKDTYQFLIGFLT